MVATNVADMEDTFAATRLALHAIAELLLAGPQYQASGRITLRPLTGGFGTTHSPDLRVEGVSVVAGDRRAMIDGRTARAIGAEVGIEPRGLSDVYHDGSGIGGDDVLHVDPDAAARIARGYALGDAAMRSVAPQHTPILWPEHFDLGVSLEAERVNLGVSPGDAHLDTPYMYVGPWEPLPADEYWNQAFGAARELPDDVEEIVAFFAEGQARLSG
jgi:hypothetical protein